MTEKHKIIAATYNEYLLIDEFISLDKHINENTNVHLDDPTEIAMIVVRKFNNNKQLIQIKSGWIFIIKWFFDHTYRVSIIISMNCGVD